MTALAWTRHEWYRLRLLRRVGTAFGAAVPVLLLAAAEGASQGWGIGARPKTYDVATVLNDASPLVLAYVWAFMTALAVSQVLADGETPAAGSWVRTLPISRRRVWGARVAAALGSVAVVVAVSGVALFVLCRTVVGPESGYPSATHAAWAGTAVVLALAGTLVAAAVVRQALLAALAGLLLGSAPIGALVAVSSLFPLAPWIGRVPAVLVVPAVLLAALPWAGWRAACAGEPAGRGRTRRAVVVVAVALAIGVGAFVGIALVARHLRCSLDRAWSFSAPPAGDRVVASIGLRGPGDLTGLFDAVTGRRIRVLDGSLRARVAWSPDGSAFATIREFTPLGGSVDPELVIHDGSDGSVLSRRSLPATPDGLPLVLDLAWCGDRVAYRTWEGGPTLVDIADPDMHATRASHLDVAAGVEAAFLGCAPSGGFLAIVGDRAAMTAYRAQAPDTRGAPPPSRVVRIDLVDGAIRATDVVEVAVDPIRLRGRLSPGGRFLMTQPRLARADEITVVDLVDGTEHRLEDAGFSVWSGWLDDGSLVWVDDREAGMRVRAWHPGDEPRAWPVPVGRATDGMLEVSPDARRVLVRTSFQIPGPEARSAKWVTEAIAVLDPATGDWTSVDRDAPGGDGLKSALGFWMSPTTVLVRPSRGPGRIVEVPPR